MEAVCRMLSHGEFLMQRFVGGNGKVDYKLETSVRGILWSVLIFMFRDWDYFLQSLEGFELRSEMNRGRKAYPCHLQEPPGYPELDAMAVILLNLHLLSTFKLPNE